MNYDELMVAPKVSAAEAIAIIGVGGLMPDAPNAKIFWQNILSKKYSIREVPPTRWRIDDYYDPDPATPDKTYCKIGAFVEDFEFDPMEFKIPPRTAEVMDPVQKWALIATKEALNDAGYLDRDFNRERTGVIFGNALSGENMVMSAFRLHLPLVLNSLMEDEILASVPEDKRRRIIASVMERLKRVAPAVNEDTMPGELSNIIAGRVANVFNLRGANYTCDAACASSLAAFDAAMGGLKRGCYDMVVVGGVDRTMNPPTYIKFCKIGALSASGSFPFDARASGFVMGEGCGVFVMKRYSDALCDNDKIYGVIVAIGSSSDGRGKGITAPNVDGQLLALERAYQMSGVNPEEEIDFIEAHGTSTRVGDVVELEVVATAVGKHRSGSNPVRLSSIKSQIGHLKSGAGAASLLKAAFALREKIIPASINFEEPNPNVNWDRIPVKVQTENELWEKKKRKPRRMGLSSFGFGGTNFHMILQEAEHPDEILARNGRRSRWVIGRGTARSDGEIASKSHTIEAESRYYAAALGIADDEGVGSGGTSTVVGGRGSDSGSIVEDVLRNVRFLGGESLEEIGGKVLDGVELERFASLREAEEFSSQNWRLAVAGKSEEDIEQKIERLKGIFSSGSDLRKIQFLKRQGVFISSENYSKVGFLYPGQGSQSVNMLRTFYDRYESFRKIFERADEVMQPIIGEKLTSIVYCDFSPDSVEYAKMEEKLKSTSVTQPAMLAADMAMTMLCAQLGIYPDAASGHSLGEYAALVSAGVLKFEDCLEIVAARGREMTAVSIDDPGMMIAVMADPETVENKIRQIGGYLVAANKNSYRQTVVAGNTASVRKAIEEFEKMDIRTVVLRVSHAFHSRIVAGAMEPLKKVLSRYDFGKPLIPVFTNVTGQHYPMDADKSFFIDILAKQIASPVEFIKCMLNMHEWGCRCFVEMGPRKVLASFAEDVLPGDRVLVSCSNNHRQGEMESLSYLFAMACCAGVVREKDKRADEVDGSGEESRQTSKLPRISVDGERDKTTKNELPEGKVIGREEIMKEILEVISEKTGYPSDMLAPDMDMEADLGIDTVKQAELFSIIRKKYNIPRQENLKLKDYPTINHVVGFVQKYATSADSSIARDDVSDEREKRSQQKVESEGGINAYEPAGKSGEEVVRDSDVRVKRIEVSQVKGRVVSTGEAIVISGVSLGLPGKTRRLFSDSNLDEITEGKNFIDRVDEEVRKKFVDLRIKMIDKGNGEEFIEKRITSPEDAIKLAGQIGIFNFEEDYGVDGNFSSAMDITSKMACAAGLEALADAKIPLIVEMKKTTTGSYIPLGWFLPEELRDDTGVIFASAFPGYNRFAEELERFFKHKFLGEDYSFDRKVLFSILAMGHSQFAQLIMARGPNLQVNAACASALIAMATACDWIKAGRCSRVVVISADNTSSEKLLPWIGGGFLASGGAATDGRIEDAAVPFGRDRHGLIVGAGAAGIVLEKESEVISRGMQPLARVVNTRISNSAFHGTRLMPVHISEQMKRFVEETAEMEGSCVEELADGLVFLSHETYTPARGGSAQAEVDALRVAFGDAVSKIIITNTKGWTGHPMGVGIEEAVAPFILHTGKVPPVANLKDIDPEFSDLNLWRGGKAEVKRVLRFSAGFGSQVAMAMLDKTSNQVNRVADEDRYQQWLSSVAGANGRSVQLFKDNRVLKAKITYEKARQSDKSSQQVEKKKEKIEIRSRDSVLKEVIRLISERTGYPEDMLDPEMDMEADLGIDTVKQAELFSIVRKKYRIPRQENLKLKDYPSINHVVDFILKHVEGESDTGGEKTQRQEVEKQRVVKPFVEEVEVEESMYNEPDFSEVKATARKVSLRWLPHARNYPRSGVELKEGEVVVLDGHSPFRKHVERQLSARGLAISDSRERLWQKEGVVIAGIVLFEDEKLYGVVSISDMPLYCQTAVDESVRRFELMKDLMSSGKFKHSGGFIIGVTFWGGGKVNEHRGYSIASGAMAGFIKSVGFEYSDCLVKTIDFDNHVTEERAAGFVIDEILHDNSNREIFVHNGMRWVAGLDEVEMKGYRLSDDVPLERKVYLVTGAGGRVMADVVRKIAFMEPSDFVLLDTVGAEMDSGEKWSANFNRIINLIDYIEEKGGSGIYIRADVTDYKQVSDAVEAGVRRYGKIDIVIHGAGIERSRSLIKKSVDEFRTVASVKILGAGNVTSVMLQCCEPEKFIFFSSVAGRFGNAGQCDYSCGNDFMSKFAQSLNMGLINAGAVSIDWTAWKGEGMAGSEAITALLEEAGIEMLERNEGLHFMWKFLKSQEVNGEVLVSGRLGILEKFSEPSMMDYDGKGDGSPAVVRKSYVFSPEKDEFLWDHAIDGTPVFPAVKGLEIFTGVGRQTIGEEFVLTGIKNCRFNRAIKFFGGEQKELIYEGKIENRGKGNLVLVCKLITEERNKVRKGGYIENFSADLIYRKLNGHSLLKERISQVVFTSDYRFNSEEFDGSSVLKEAEIYKYFFHRNQFKVVDSFTLLKERHEAGIGFLSRFSRRNLGGLFLLIEFGMQTAGLYLMRTAGIAGLPSKIGYISVVGSISDNSEHQAVALFRGMKKLSEYEIQYRFDVFVKDKEGRAVCWLNGLELVETGKVDGIRVSNKALPRMKYSYV